jgi:hypothetical protein
MELSGDPSAHVKWGSYFRRDPKLRILDYATLYLGARLGNRGSECVLDYWGLFVGGVVWWGDRGLDECWSRKGISRTISNLFSFIMH